MIDKQLKSAYDFNPAFYGLFMIFVPATFLIFSCLWFRKTFRNVCPDKSFKGLEETEESYFNDIAISPVPTVSFPSQPQVIARNHSFENNYNLPYNNPVSFEPFPARVSKKALSSVDDLFGQLRPRIARVGLEFPTGAEEVQKQLDIIKSISEGSFSRSQLQYTKELGVSKFAKVLHAEAYNIQPGRKRTQVVVVMVDASTHPAHQTTLLREVLSYRGIKHANVMKFYCLCTEMDPSLAIYESFKIGDLKTYLRSHRSEMQSFLNQGIVLSMLCDVIAGLQALHQMGYVHRDLALRNCMLSNDMVVKIGDHGLSEQLYKDDYYYNTNNDDIGIPIRWMAPESLSLHYSLSVNEITKEANIWTMGIVMWEMLRGGDVPYPDLSNDYVIRLVAIEKQVKPQRPLVVIDNIKQMYELMEMCWAYEVEDRPSVRQLKILLLHLSSSKSSSDVTFLQKWNQLKPIVASKNGVVDENSGMTAFGGGGGGDDDDVNVNNNNNNNSYNTRNGGDDDDYYMSDSDLFGGNYSNLSALTADSTNNLSLAEELKLHLHDPPSPEHAPSIDPLHSAFQSRINFALRPTAQISIDNDEAPNEANRTNSGNARSIPELLSTVRGYDSTPLSSAFDENSLLKMARYNHYLQTVTTSIDEPLDDVEKGKYGSDE